MPKKYFLRTAHIPNDKNIGRYYIYGAIKKADPLKTFDML